MLVRSAVRNDVHGGVRDNYAQQVWSEPLPDYLQTCLRTGAKEKAAQKGGFASANNAGGPKLWVPAPQLFGATTPKAGGGSSQEGSPSSRETVERTPSGSAHSAAETRP